MTTLKELVLGPNAQIERVEAHLEALSPEGRRAAVLRFCPPAQRRLWQMARARVVTLDDLVPPETPTLNPVMHHGRNTLPVLTRFQKPMCRGTDGQVFGYNEGPSRRLVGPGYFVCRDTQGDSRGGVVIDYTQGLSGPHPDDWPAHRANTAGMSRFVYAHMHDYLRRISAHVVIGRAYRHDRETPNLFVLCRAP